MQRTVTGQFMYDNCIEIECCCSGSRNKTRLESKTPVFFAA